jgi:Glu-tRNA(Gln) amidotransferase subunit E-like FAD-binding protein
MFKTNYEESPMDPVTLATTVLAVLTPYLAKAGEKLANNVIDSLPEHAGKLWSALANKFKGKPAAEEAMTDLAKKPEDEDNKAAVRKQIKKAAEEEPEFLLALAALLENARKEAVMIQGSAVARDNGIAVNVGGSVQGNIVIGNDNDINATKPSLDDSTSHRPERRKPL